MHGQAELIQFQLVFPIPPVLRPFRIRCFHQEQREAAPFDAPTELLAASI
jgi:hypothetical protein